MSTVGSTSAASSGRVARVRRGIDRRGWRGLAREAVTRPVRPALAPAAARSLRAQAGRVRDREALLDLAFGFDHHGITIAPGQVRSEIRALLELVAAGDCRRMLEIGTANGGSLFLFAQTVRPDAHIISVDLHHGQFGGGYPAWKLPLYRAFARDGQRLDLVRGDSHAPETVAQVHDLLGAEPLDFLFIDGDHTYDGVRRDFETYGPLVRPGGLIAFHDIAAPRAGAGDDGRTLLVGEVPRYWAEVREGRWSEAFADAPDGCFGIGVLRA